MKLRFIRSPHRALLLCCAALLQSVAMPAFAQNSEFGTLSVLRGQGTPLSIKASELTPEWRRFAANPQQSDLRALLEESRAPVVPPFYTRGETVKAGTETFLIAYRLSSTAAAAALVTNSSPRDDGGEEAAQAAYDHLTRLRAGDVLNLALLNLRTMGDITDVRAFDSARDILNEQEQKRLEILNSASQSESNLKQIGLGLLMYAQDYDEKFPPMRSVQSKAEITQPIPGKPSTVQQVLQPYVKSADIFVHPISREIYRPNLAVSGVVQSSVSDPAHTVAFWEKSATDGTRAVLYLDGHVKRERESDWPRIMAESNKLVPPRELKPKPARVDLDNAVFVVPAVKTQLGANAAMNGSNITVSTTDQVLTLEGTVNREAQRTLALQIARKYAPGYRIVDRLDIEQR